MDIRKINDLPLIEIYEDFLSNEQCSKYLQLPLVFNKSKAFWYDANNNKVAYHSGRTSETAYARGSAEERELKEKISNVFSVDINTIEDLHFTRYSNNQEYRAHHDYFKEGILLTNNRIYTLIIYLNDNYTGGYTEFPLIGKTIMPKTGRALFFKFNYGDGDCNNLTLHAGLPVTFGTKNIITAWFREKPIND